MGETANIFLELMTLVILGGIVALLALALGLESWLRAWEQRLPSPLMRLIERLAIDPQRVATREARREITHAQQDCPQCPAVGRCHAWIDSGRTDASYREFCPNAALVERLAERRRP